MPNGQKSGLTKSQISVNKILGVHDSTSSREVPPHIDAVRAFEKDSTSFKASIKKKNADLKSGKKRKDLLLSGRLSPKNKADSTFIKNNKPKKK